MTIPLSVRVGDRTITRRCDDLTFRKTVHGTAEIGLKLSESLASVVAPFERVYVYDGTTADTVADGRLEDPGRTLTEDGQQWDMSAVGDVARAADRAAPYIIIDQDLGRWLREQAERATSADASATDVPSITGTDGLVMQYNPGEPIDNSSTIVMAYRAIEQAGMLVGGIEYTCVAGYNGVGFACRMHAANANGSISEMLRSDNFSTTPNSRYATLSDSTPLPAGTTNVQLTVKRVSGGATNVRADTVWGAHYDVTVKAARYNLDGTLNTTNADYLAGRMVHPHEIVTDVLVRLLSGVYDTATAQIDTSSTYPINQFAFPDGITAEGILTELMNLLPDFYWQVGSADPVTGKAAFTWRKWPTHIRYVASLKDGINLPGADAERYNRVTVRWVDKRGRTRTKTYNAGTTISGTFVPVVAELETAGPADTRLVRAPEIQDLADEIGSEALADKFAAEFLLAHGTPPVSGTLTVAHKVYDQDLGRYVQPWEIQPGHLVFVEELADTAADYSTTGRNGRSVFRVVGMSYTAAENAASLELDAPPRTDQVLLAKQVTKRRRKR